MPGQLRIDRGPCRKQTLDDAYDLRRSTNSDIRTASLFVWHLQLKGATDEPFLESVPQAQAVWLRIEMRFFNVQPFRICLTRIE